MVFRIGRQHPGRAKDARHDGRDHAPYAKNPSNFDRVQRPAAAEGDHGHVARIAATLDRHGANRTRHVDVGDSPNAVRGGDHVKPKRLANGLVDRCAR